MSFGVVDNDETATERRTYGPTFVVLFRLLSAHKQLSLYPRGRWGDWGIWLSMKQHYSSGRRKGKILRTTKSRIIMYPEQEQKSK